MLILGLQVDDLRGSPMSVGNLEEIIDEKSVTLHYGPNLLTFSIDLRVLTLIFLYLQSCHSVILRGT